MVTSESIHVNRAVLPIGFRVLPAEGRPAAIEITAAEAITGSLEDQLKIDIDLIAREAHDEGVREGLARAAETLDSQLQRERIALTAFLEQFAREKDCYFLGVEAEVVRLALAIAERILHREVSLDPLLLSAAARVALEQVADGSKVILRVPPDEIDRWRDVFRRKTDTVDIQGDNSLGAGDCVLDTQSGSVQLGTRAQLQEIEQGFFELLQRRPAAGLTA